MTPTPEQWSEMNRRLWERMGGWRCPNCDAYPAKINKPTAPKLGVREESYRNLPALITGWYVEPKTETCPDHLPPPDLRTDPAGMLELLGFMRVSHFDCHISRSWHRTHPDRTMCNFTDYGVSPDWPEVPHGPKRKATHWAPTLPEAIFVAAAKALGIWQEVVK